LFARPIAAAAIDDNDFRVRRMVTQLQQERLDQCRFVVGGYDD